MTTSIEWTDKVWNVLRGCTRVSAGCVHCYAERQAARFAGPGQPYEGLVRISPKADGRREPRWTGAIRFVPEKLDEPLSWRKPCRVFVNSMSDLFHEGVSDEQIAAIFGVMAACPQHTFQVLTKRPERARAWFRWIAQQDADAPSGVTPGLLHANWCALRAEAEHHRQGDAGPLHTKFCADPGGPWPLPNVWLGVSVEDQPTADERIPLLLDTPAAVRWVSYEPALGPVDFTRWTGYNGGDDHLSKPGRRDLSGRWNGARDRSTGANLADRGAARGPMGWRDEGHSVHAPTSGEPGARLLAGPRDDRRHSLSSDGPQAGLPALQGADSRGDDGESRQRREDGQPAGEPGTGDLCRAGRAREERAPAWPARSGRHAQRNGEADSRSGGGDPSTSQGRGVAEVDRVCVQSVGQDGIEDRARASLDWVVIGGESGPGARPFDLAWARSTIEACRAAGVPVFFKQAGARPHDGARRSIVDRHGVAAPSLSPEEAERLAPGYEGGRVEPAWLRLRDRKGGGLSELPKDLRVREWPEVSR